MKIIKISYLRWFPASGPLRGTAGQGGFSTFPSLIRRTGSPFGGGGVYPNYTKNIFKYTLNMLIIMASLKKQGVPLQTVIENLLITKTGFQQTTALLNPSKKEGVKGILPLGCLPLWGREGVTLKAVEMMKRITGK